MPDQQAYFSDLHQKGVKLALIGEFQEDLPYATFDELMGMREAIDHFHSLGHRRIGYVGPFLPRLDIFCQAMRERDLPVEESHLLTYEHFGPDVAQFREFLQRKPRVTALIAYQDSVFFPLYEYTRTIGIRILEDLSIIGHGKLRECPILSPQLTSIDQSPHAVGCEAGRIMLDLTLKRVPRQGHQMTLESRLVIRESTAKPFAGSLAKNGRGAVRRSKKS